MMLALFIVTLLTPQTVTFTHPCAHSSVVLDALGKQIGKTIKPSGSVTKDFFLVSFTDVPTQEALDKIAQTLNATWEEKDGTTWLTRTRAQEVAEEKEAREADAKLIADWLAKRDVSQPYTEEHAKKLIEAVIPLMQTDDGGQRYEEFQSVNQGSPLHRLMTRLLREIGPAALADVGDTGEAHYVLDPSPGLRRLPNGQAFRVFEQENAVHKKAFAAVSFERDPSRGMFYSSLVSPYAQNFWSTRETRLTVSKGDGYISIQLSVKDLGQESATITSGPRDGSSLPKELTSQPGEYVATPMEKSIANSVMVVFGGEGARTTIPEDVARVFLDPVENEPLTVYGSRWMLESAKGLGKNIVALLSDECSWMAIASIAQGRSTYSQMWTILPQLDLGFTATVDEKWVTLRPTDAGSVRNDRVDREKWRAIIRSGFGKTEATLEQYAAYAALTNRDILVMLSMVPAAITGQPINPDSAMRMEQMDVYRLYGRITPAQQALARQGGVELMLSGLTPGQAYPARKIVFGRYASVAQSAGSRGWDMADAYGERTEATDPNRLLGGGAPNGSKVRIYVLENDLYYARPQGQYRSYNGMTLEQYANNKARFDTRPQEYDPDYGFIATGKAEQIVVEFEFPGIGYVTKRVQLDRVNRDTIFKRISELPEDVQKEFDALYKKALERYKGIGGEPNH